MSFYLRKYMWLISLVAVATCSYFLARLTANLIASRFASGGSGISALVVKPKSGVNKQVIATEEDLNALLERNIFDSKAIPPSQKVAGEESENIEEVDPNGEAVQTSLSVKLISTFSVGGGLDERSSAVISSGGRNGQDVYTVNDKKQFSPDTKIVKVFNTRIEFINKGRLEFLELEDFAKGVDINRPPQRDNVVSETRGGNDQEESKIEEKGGGKFVIDRSEIDAAINNLDKLYTQVRAVPHFKEGKANGLKLLSVRADSIFGKLGLKRGDILQKINGMELDIKRGLEIFNQLKSENQITIDIERQDKSVTQEYEIR